MDDNLKNRLGGDRLASRQVDELIGLARGLCADGVINDPEAEFLQSWLVANADASDQPILRDLLDRVSVMLRDGDFSTDERTELFELLEGLTGGRIELGETLKSSDLPICTPKPDLRFQGVKYCFTGTFAFGERKRCEAAIQELGAQTGSLTRQTQVLVIGAYATPSWKHSSMGNKIMKAVDMREQGLPIQSLMKNIGVVSCRPHRQHGRFHSQRARAARNEARRIIFAPLSNPACPIRLPVRASPFRWGDDGDGRCNSC